MPPRGRQSLFPPPGLSESRHGGLARGFVAMHRCADRSGSRAHHGLVDIDAAETECEAGNPNARRRTGEDAGLVVSAALSPGAVTARRCACRTHAAYK